MSFRRFLLIFISTCFLHHTHAGNADSLLKRGWAALVKDKDTEAIQCFELAYEISLKENNTENIAASLLNLGISYYGLSQSKGLEYCFSAMAYYQKLERVNPEKALNGRSRCLQLVSTIYARQGKYRQAVLLSREALSGFDKNETEGNRGLAYSTIAGAYAKLNLNDSSEYYYHKALAAQLAVRSFVYLPSCFIKLGDIELKNNHAAESKFLYDRALVISDSSENKQAQVTSLLGLVRWHLVFGKIDSAEIFLTKAHKVAIGLSDKSFYLKTLEQFLLLRKQQNNFKEALMYRDEIAGVKDSINSFDQRKLAKTLEAQFDLAEKDRKLLLLQKEKDIATLSNYLLWATISFLIIFSACIIIFLRRINNRDKLLLQTKDKLVKAIEEQNNISEKYLQNELEFRESQLSAMAFQILQKNELMQELKLRLDENTSLANDPILNKLLTKGLNHEKEWDDFNVYFESINKNFYTKLKSAYPGISQNDLKLAALIKLNLSIKEMAGMLNISPDSVKTARYRLRKKLSLSTEDNLTEFILKL